jgi:putative holliday junction resolvase
MRILSIDYGEKRVGTAVGDTVFGIAFPRDILPNNNALFSTIEELCKKEKIERIIVGYPLPFSAERNAQSQIAEQFADDLEDELGIAVEFFCERFTTKVTERLLQKAGYSTKEQRGLKDSIAAMIILQGVLEREEKNCH